MTGHYGAVMKSTPRLTARFRLQGLRSSATNKQYKLMVSRCEETMDNVCRRAQFSIELTSYTINRADLAGNVSRAAKNIAKQRGLRKGYVYTR